MKTKLTRIAVAAIFGLAITFTLSCGDHGFDDFFGDSSSSGTPSSSSSVPSSSSRVPSSSSDDGWPTCSEVRAENAACYADSDAEFYVCMENYDDNDYCNVVSDYNKSRCVEFAWQGNDYNIRLCTEHYKSTECFEDIFPNKGSYCFYASESEDGGVLSDCDLIGGNYTHSNEECLNEKDGEVISHNQCKSRGATIFNLMSPPEISGSGYETVEIGGNVWMKKNLNIDTEVGISRCYDNNNATCNIYGRLYNWDAAMAACPDGWRLPSDTDWGYLMQSVNTDCMVVGDCPLAGHILKTGSGWLNDGNGIDTYGFAALPGGFYDEYGFRSVGLHGYWWSSSQGDAINAYARSMNHYDRLVKWDLYDKSRLFSVRCVKEFTN